jgi:hypothetical protein
LCCQQQYGQAPHGPRPTGADTCARHTRAAAAAAAAAAAQTSHLQLARVIQSSHYLRQLGQGGAIGGIIILNNSSCRVEFQLLLLQWLLLLLLVLVLLSCPLCRLLCPFLNI